MTPSADKLIKEPQNLHDIALELRKLADEIDKPNGTDLGRFGVVCAVSMPCENEKKEGHQHQQIGIFCGGSMGHCAEAHFEAMKRLRDLAPMEMMMIGIKMMTDDIAERRKNRSGEPTPQVRI